MNESMNFGDLGFSSVTTEEVDNTPAFSTEEKEKEKKEKKKEEEAKVDVEEVKKKDAEAAKDFESSVVNKNLKNYEEDAANFSNIDFGPMQKYLDDDDITDISYSNGGQLWLKSLSRGVYRADQQEVDNALMEKIAFQCSNIMGKTFNMAHPFLDSESAELRMNFVHDSIARNGIAVVFRKTPAKIRLEKEKLLKEKYVQLNIHDFLINCVLAHCNIIVCGETGSGKTELVKYLASHTRENEKLISIEDTLELHLDRIYPHRDIVAMKTNNIASYSDVLVTCMRQNPIWILLSEVRSAEAVTAVRNSISSGHYILSTIHADKAESIPHRMYSLLESNIDVEQFLKTIYRYVQIGVFVRGRYKPEEKRFVREIAGICEFHVTDDEKAEFTNIYLKNVQGEETFQQPSKYLLRFLEGQGCDLNNLFGENKSFVTDGMDLSKIKSPKVKIGDKEEEIKPPVNPNGPVPPKKEEKLEEEVKEVKEELNEVKEELKQDEEKIEEQIEEIKEEVKPEEKVETASQEPKEEVKTEKQIETTVEEPKEEIVPAPEMKVELPDENKTEVTEKAPVTAAEETKTEELPVQEETKEEPVEVTPEESAETPKEEVKEETAPETPAVEQKLEAPPVEEVQGEAPKVELEEEAPKVEETVETAPEPVQETPTVEPQQAEVPQTEPAPEAPKPEMEVSVQEAMPLETTNKFEITGSSPNDIVAKPMIDIATLEEKNPEPEVKPEPVPEPAPVVEEQIPAGPLTTDPGTPQIDINQSVGEAPTLQNIVPQQQIVQPVTQMDINNNQYVNTQNQQVPQGALGVVGQTMMQPNNMMLQPQQGYNPQGFMAPPNQMNMQMNNMNYSMGPQMGQATNMLTPPDQNYQTYQANQMTMPQGQYYA